MSNKKWRQTKKANYTFGERVGNIANKIAFRVATTAVMGGMGIAADEARNQGRGFENFKKAANPGILHLIFLQNESTWGQRVVNLLREVEEFKTFR